MKKRNKKILLIFASILATSTSLFALLPLQYQNNTKNKIDDWKLKSLAHNLINKNIETLIKNSSLIDLSNNSLNIDFIKRFEKMFPHELKDLVNNTTNIQYILKDLISYSDKPNNNAIFSTNLTFNDFYNKFSQLNSEKKPIDQVIYFQYDQNDGENPFTKIANGEVQLIAKIGENIKHLFKFNDNQYELKFNLVNLKKQYDIYFRNEAVGDLTWNETNVADDSIVKPFIIDGVNNKSLVDMNLLSSNEMKKYFLDNLVTYENNNGQKINENKGLNSILATNLSQKDFNNIIKYFQADVFVGSGKVKVTIALDTSGGLDSNNDFQNVWLSNKQKSLSDTKGSFSQTKISKMEFKTFWISGWKKDYSFNKNKDINNSIIELDASKIKDLTSNLFLNRYKASEIKSMVASGSFDELFKNLIGFKAYNQRLEDLKTKLMITNLSFLEFKTLVKNELMKFIDKEQANINSIDDFEGVYNGQLKIDNSFVGSHWVKNKFENNFVQFPTKGQTLINFKINNLKQNMFFKMNSYNLDFDNFIKVDWLANQTINEFFFGQNQTVLLPNQQPNINDDQIKKIKQKILDNFVKYRYNGKQFNENDFAGFPILSNALDSSSVDKIVSIDNQSFKYDLEKGQFQVKLIFNYQNGLLNNSNEKNITIKISGFKSEKPIQKYDFFENQNGKIIDIQQFNQQSLNKVDLDPSKLDANWVIDNLIEFSTNQNPTSNLKIFSTNATKEEFVNSILYKTTYIGKGIELQTSNDGSTIDGKIYLKKEKINFQQNVEDNYLTYHFKIVNFPYKFNYEIINNFNINSINNDFMKNIFNVTSSNIIDNLFSFSDYFKDNFIFKTNLTKKKYFESIFENIEIIKNFDKNTINIVVSHKNQENKININIIGFYGNILFETNENIYIDDKKFLLVNIKSDDIVNQFMNFNNERKNKYSILNTNISKNEFESDYLDYVNIVDRNYQFNWLDIEIYFKKPIQNKTKSNFRIFYNPEAINIFNINQFFDIKLNNVDPNTFNYENLFNYISFNSYLEKENSVFSINISKEEFISLIDINDVVINPNPKNGSINIKLKFNKFVNIDNSVLENTNKSSNINYFEFNVFGFKSSTKVNLNSIVNASAYTEFNNINSMNDINKDFIFNLISYNNTQEGILGQTNISKEDFKNLTNINIYSQGNKVFVDFSFKSFVNENEKNARIILENLPFLGYNKVNNKHTWIIVVIGSLLFIGLIALSIILPIYLKKKIKNKKRFIETNKNKIM